MTTAMYFPIAAAGAVNDPSAAAYHKRWLVVDQQGVWLSQSHCDKLAEIQVQLRLGFLVIRAPGMLRLDVPLDVIEDDDSVRGHALVGRQQIDVVDEGDVAAAWMSNFLERPCRLVKVHPEAGRVLWPEL